MLDIKINKQPMDCDVQLVSRGIVRGNVRGIVHSKHLNPHAGLQVSQLTTLTAVGYTVVEEVSF